MKPIEIFRKNGYKQRYRDSHCVKRQELEYACDVLKIITSDEFVDIWNNRY